LSIVAYFFPFLRHGSLSFSDVGPDPCSTAHPCLSNDAILSCDSFLFYYPAFSNYLPLQAASMIRTWYLRQRLLLQAKAPPTKAQRAAQQYLDEIAPALAEWDATVADLPANAEERRRMYRYRAKYRVEAPQVPTGSRMCIRSRAP
jgi:hypothetical protein